MEGQIGLAERHRVGPEDIQFYRQQVLEPSTVWLTACGLLTLGVLAWRRHARSAPREALAVMILPSGTGAGG